MIIARKTITDARLMWEGLRNSWIPPTLPLLRTPNNWGWFREIKMMASFVSLSCYKSWANEKWGVIIWVLTSFGRAQRQSGRPVRRCCLVCSCDVLTLFESDNKKLDVVLLWKLYTNTKPMSRDRELVDIFWIWANFVKKASCLRKC